MSGLLPSVCGYEKGYSNGEEGDGDSWSILGTLILCLGGNFMKVNIHFVKMKVMLSFVYGIHLLKCANKV